MVSAHSVPSKNLDLLAYEQLFSLSISELRQQCELAGLDDRSVDTKDELIALLYNSYNANDNYENQGIILQMDSVGSHRSSFHRGNMDNEILRTLEDLNQMIPFYGQGDLQSDKVVRDTMLNLPQETLDARDSFGNSLIMLACQSRAYDLVQILIGRGSDVNSENNDGATCLHFACYIDSLSVNVAQLLLKNGAKAQVTENQYGCTPLHWAASAGDLMLCRMLCDAGADPTTVDSRGYDPVAYAQQGKSLRCSEYLLQMRNIVLGRKATTTFGANLEPEWERNIDVTSGQAYYYDRTHGVSLWEDEYFEMLRKNDTRTNLNASFSMAEESLMENLVSPSRFDINSNHRMCLQVVESNADASTRDSPFSFQPEKNAHSILSPIRGIKTNAVKQDENEVSVSFGPSEDLSAEKGANARTTLTKEAFEDRLASLQVKMENQLNEQLKRMEEKMYAPKIESQENVVKTNEAISELSSRVIKLQTDIGSKDLEILSLRREVANLELNLANSAQTSLSSLEKLSDDGWWSPRKVQMAQRDLDALPKEIGELHASMTDLRRKLDDSSRELLLSTEKNNRLEKMVQSLDITLDEERYAKEKAVRLFEQSKKGTEIDREIARSLEEAREREKENFSKLRSELVAVEEKAEIDRRSLLEKIEEKEKQLTEQSQKMLRMDANFKDQQRIRDEEIRQSKDGQSSLLTTLQSQLNEERMAKIERDVKLSDLKTKMEDICSQKDQAILEMEEAKKKMREEIQKIQGMQGMINDAKLLLSRNEQLSRELSRETDRRKELHNKLEDLKGRIRVYVRLRPLSQSEVERKCENVLRRDDKRTCVLYPDPEDNMGMRTWEFDHVFCGTLPEENTQIAVFRDTQSLVTSAVDGVNVCIFAYGQTGSGKTFTMFGKNGVGHTIDIAGKLDDDCGLAPRVAEEVFKVLLEKDGSSETSVTVSMFELYTDVLRDLLAVHQDSALKIKLAEHSETGMVEVENTVKAAVKNARELLQVFKKGAASRTTSATKMNADSSRSHLITMIMICVKNRRTGNTVRGKLTLVDLAGSERVSKSGAAGLQLKEAQSINKSLSALGDVISALTTGSKHVPYRNHPLTMLMSDSLGGSAKTLMFVCCSPADYNREESACALEFAKRCKDVKNNISGGRKDLMSEVKSLRTEISRLKKERENAALK